MASLIIRQLDDGTKRKLRLRAAQRGRSMEAEARDILRSALTSCPPQENLAEAIHQRFARLGGIELELPRRDAIRQAADFPD